MKQHQSHFEEMLSGLSDLQATQKQTGLAVVKLRERIDKGATVPTQAQQSSNTSAQAFTPRLERLDTMLSRWEKLGDGSASVNGTAVAPALHSSGTPLAGAAEAPFRSAVNVAEELSRGAVLTGALCEALQQMSANLQRDCTEDGLSVDHLKNGLSMKSALLSGYGSPNGEANLAAPFSPYAASARSSAPPSPYRVPPPRGGSAVRDIVTRC